MDFAKKARQGSTMNAPLVIRVAVRIILMSEQLVRPLLIHGRGGGSSTQGVTISVQFELN